MHPEITSILRKDSHLATFSYSRIRLPSSKSCVGC